jgi:hypothetical protein
VTAQLEAVAIRAHLYRLAYFLGMAKAESERIVRISGDPEAERELARLQAQHVYRSRRSALWGIAISRR